MRREAGVKTVGGGDIDFIDVYALNPYCLDFGIKRRWEQEDAESLMKRLLTGREGCIASGSMGYRATEELQSWKATELQSYRNMELTAKEIHRLRRYRNL